MADTAPEWRYFRVLAPYACPSRDEEMAWLRASWFAPSPATATNATDGSDGAPPPLVAAGDADEEAAQWRALCEGLSPVAWLPFNVYRIPKHVFLSKSSLHRDGRIVGMDAASAASVVALGAAKGHSVLDVCCCPGMKLKLISEVVKGAVEDAAGVVEEAKKGRSGGIAVGVDISIKRLFVARSLMTKLGASNTVLTHCDGTVFDPSALAADVALRRPPARQKALLKRLDAVGPSAAIGPDGVHRTTAVWLSEDLQAQLTATNIAMGKRPRRDAEAGVKVTEEGTDGKEVAQSPQLPLPFVIPEQFDRVLVDAECTHDGSLHHIVPPSPPPQSAPAGGDSACAAEATARPISFQSSLHKYKPNYALHTDGAGDEALHDLQFALLARGWALTRPGGVLVYSTCSFSEGQNEGIVRRFLAAHGGGGSAVGGDGCVAALVPPFAFPEGAGGEDFGAPTLAALEAVAEEGLGGFGVRMNPSRTLSSFQYIAKFRKEVL